MATFSPETKPYLGNPTGAVNISQRESATVGRAVGNLFGDVASIGDQYLKNRQSYETVSLAKDVQKNVDNLGRETLFNEDPDTEKKPLPAGMSAAAAQLDRYRQAYKQGKLSDTYWLTQVSKISKSLRSQYPQFIDQIDDLISNATGTSVANQIRRELLSQFENETKNMDAASNKRLTILGQTNQYVSDADVLSTYKTLTGRDFDPNTFEESSWLVSVGIREKEDNDRARVKSILELNEAQGRADEKTAVSAGIAIGQNLQKRILGTLLSGLNDQTAKALEDGKVSLEEEAALTSSLNQIQTQVSSAFYNEMTSLDKTGKSIYQRVPSEAGRKAIEETFFGPLNIARKALLDKDIGMLTALQRNNTAAKLYSENAFLNSPDARFSERLQRAKEVYGADYINELQQKRAQGKGTLEEKAMGDQLFQYLTTDLPLTTLVQRLDATNNTTAVGQILPELNNTVIGVLSPDVPKEAAAAVMEKFFEEEEYEFINKYAKSDPLAVFQLLASPQMTEKLKGTPVFPKYVEWATQNIKAFARQAADQIIDTQVYTDSAKIKYDETSRRFVYDYDKAYETLGTFEGAKLIAGNQAVNQMNSYLSIMESISQAEGTDPKTSTDVFLLQFFQSNDYKKLEKQGSILTRMKDSVLQFLKDRQTDDVSGTIPPKDTKATKFLIEQEGYKSKPYWDTNAWRVGFGSDTVTREDGTVEKVTPETKITKADAERDLSRRTSEYSADISSVIGEEKFSILSPSQKEALLSLAHNYGKVPKKVLQAVKEGKTDAEIARAISKLPVGRHPSKTVEVLRRRRNLEAQLWLQ